MNIYSGKELDSVKQPVSTVKPASEPVDVDLSGKIEDILSSGGDLSVKCTLEEFNEVFTKFKPQRRACKLQLNWSDGVLNASARV